MVMVLCVTVERSVDSKWQTSTCRQRNSFLSSLSRSSPQGEYYMFVNNSCLLHWIFNISVLTVQLDTVA